MSEWVEKERKERLRIRPSHVTFPSFGRAEGSRETSGLVNDPRRSELDKEIRGRQRDREDSPLGKRALAKCRNSLIV